MSQRRVPHCMDVEMALRPVQAHFLAHPVMLLVLVGHAYQRHGEFQGLELRHQLLHGQLGGASHESHEPHHHVCRLSMSSCAISHDTKGSKLKGCLPVSRTSAGWRRTHASDVASPRESQTTGSTSRHRRYDDRQSGGNVVFFHGIKIGAGATLASWATGAEHVEALGRHNGRPRVGGQVPLNRGRHYRHELRERFLIVMSRARG
ncbi:hypothetical protein ZEAMMB73_Zm00001d009860 [Zea mays]|uniref:Uncharacterized protein n=1 Tax=Zea mays TaxID=4577 RepID=K7V283_MAIZE|nr:hypothetical protein ZEAMMB73_Zm00001d009860 [Zea mays]